MKTPVTTLLSSALHFEPQQTCTPWRYHGELRIDDGQWYGRGARNHLTHPIQLKKQQNWTTNGYITCFINTNNFYYLLSAQDYSLQSQLAGSWRSFRHISPGYKHRALAAWASKSGCHGYFLRVWRKVSRGADIVFQRICQKFKSSYETFTTGFNQLFSNTLTETHVSRLCNFLTTWVKSATNIIKHSTQYLHQKTTSLFTSLMSASSSTLLSNNRLSPFCIECNTVTSSIASESTTLCPTIPNSISFGELDGLTVGSGASMDNMSGGMEDTARSDKKDHSNSADGEVASSMPQGAVQQSPSK